MSRCPGQKWDTCLTMKEYVRDCVWVLKTSWREVSSFLTTAIIWSWLLDRVCIVSFVFLLISWQKKPISAQPVTLKDCRVLHVQRTVTCFRNMNRKLCLPTFGSSIIYCQLNDSLKHFILLRKEKSPRAQINNVVPWYPGGGALIWAHCFLYVRRRYS